MPAPISVLIPTLNAAPHLGPTLACLTEGLTAGLIREVILSDGGSTDDIAQIAEGVGARLMTGPPGRGGQLARAAAAARGDWLLALHADSRPAPGWAGAVQAHIAGHADRAGYFDLRFDRTGPAPRLVAGWANLRARAARLPYGDQGLLMPAALYRHVGGYRDMPLMEDVALARALGRRMRPLGHVIVTSADRYVRDGWLRRGARNLSTLALYRLGADPVWLAQRYRR
ncbi:MAG: TIGR04283 family arsenosugar biosynthesis glycosyltransferase [Pseudomonadota bacterium]